MHKVYALLGLCMRAGKISGGEAAAHAAIRSGECRLLIISEDASENTKKKFANAATYYKVDCLQWGTKEALGRAIGKAQRSVLAVCEEGFAAQLRSLCQTKEEGQQ